MALAGHTVLVTRPRHQSAELVALLEARGAAVLELPVLTVGLPRDLAPLEAALARIGDYDLVALGSQNALQVMETMARGRGTGLGGVPFAPVGEKTAALLRARGLEVAVVPATYRAEALAEAIGAHFGGALDGRRILFPRAEEGREVLIEALTARGAEVDAPIAYRTVTAPPADAAAIAALDRATACTFLSGRTAAGFLEVVPEGAARAFLARVVVAVIGPVAAGEAARLGIRVDVVPPVATAEALVEALDAHLAPPPARG